MRRARHGAIGRLLIPASASAGSGAIADQNNDHSFFVFFRVRTQLARLGPVKRERGEATVLAEARARRADHCEARCATHRLERELEPKY